MRPGRNSVLIDNSMFRKITSPCSVAVIGASDTAGKIGNMMLTSLIEYGYRGRLYPVNPKYRKVVGLTCYSSIRDATKANNGPVEMVYIALPEETVADVVKECIENGAGIVVILSPSTDTSVRVDETEKDLLKTAISSGTLILGPNCLGIYSPSGGLSFSPRLSRKDGKIAFISQSGSMCELFVLSMQDRGLGVGTAISTGNELMVSVEDLIAPVVEFSGAEVVAIYAEQIRSPQKFIDQCRKISSYSQVVVYKAGNTESGRRAAMSHTGAIAGMPEAYSAIFKKALAAEVRSYDDLVSTVTASALSRSISGRRVGAISAPGGLCVTLSDALERYGFSLPEIDEPLALRLGEILGRSNALRNPLDLTMSAISNIRLYGETCSEFARSGLFDFIVVGAPTSFSIAPFVEEMKRVTGEISIPLCVVWQGDDPGVRDGLRMLNSAGIPVFGSPESIASSIDRLLKIRKRSSRQQNENPVFDDVGRANATERTGDRGRWLSVTEIAALLSAHHIVNFEEKPVSDIDAAIEFTASGSYPFVLKKHWEGLTHKSAHGAVITDIYNTEMLRKAWEQLERISADGVCAGEYVTITPQIKGGIELAIGSFRGPGNCAVMMFGLGGTLIEYCGRKSFALAPVSDAEAEELIEECGLEQMFRLSGSQRWTEMSAVRAAITDFSRMVASEDRILEMDVNPLICRGSEYFPVDVKIMVSE